MDEDLKTYLRAMEDRTAALIAGVEDRTAARIAGVEDRTAARIAGVEDHTTELANEMRKLEDRTAALIAGELGSLHTGIQNSEIRMRALFDSIDSRLKLQAGLIQSGARAMARFSEFSENSEDRWVALVARVEALERKVSGGNHGNGAH
jgi:hypothetical protein